MSVSASATGEPGRPVRTGSRPVVLLWALLVAGLLAVLPCAGAAKAVGLPTRHAAPVTTAGPHATDAATAPVTGHADGSWVHGSGEPPVWCAADDGHPLPGKGCSSHPFNGPQAQLPNAPPQPVAVTLPQLVTVRALPPAPPVDTPDASGPAPDLHVLQVHRS
ncbi:hypothetical protein KNE206_15820 [Kitasatospora sp. NE20-6]|uniref:hypothetical protein n=1 Tax=Kitasatospora sp. NE20-6 TaxID=2859066 RepID=UPI0034DC99B0